MWFGRPTHVSVSCFGKLPLYADFIEPFGKVTHDPLIRDWITAAVRGDPDTEGGPERIPYSGPYRILLPSDRVYQVAVLWLSRDARGRFFPFTLYTEFRRKDLKDLEATAL
ncbi:MAG: hypothetical protein AAF517_26835, partial [Planctomycetota bacterium]